MSPTQSTPFTVMRDELPTSGRELTFEVGPEWCSEILSDGVYRVVGPVRFEGRVDRFDREVLLQLRASVELSFTCSRCGEPSTSAYATGLAHLFAGSSERSSIPIPIGVHLDPELDVTEGVGSIIDTEPAIVSAFAAELAPYPLCSDACPGPGTWTPERAALREGIDPRLAPLQAIRARMESSEPTTDELS